MGTSTSSSGPGAGVSFDPPWLDELVKPATSISEQGDSDASTGDTAESADDADAQPNTDAGAETAKQPEQTIAPPRRFATARRALGGFARTGSKESLRKAVGGYSKNGMGGAGNAAKRMRASTSSAAGLFSLLQAARDGSDPNVMRWVDSLAARTPSAQEVIDEIIRHTTTSGGSVDEESCKNSMAQALGELLERRPEIDLLQMSNDDIWAVIGLFLAHEACNRLLFDVGQLFESARLDPREVVARNNEMRQYLKAEIAAQIQNVRELNNNPGPKQLNSMIEQALKNTFLVFEEDA